MATDRAFSHTSAAPSQTRWRSSVVHAAILIGMFACVIGMLILGFWTLSGFRNPRIGTSQPR